MDLGVLIDAECESSCESTLEGLQLHPNVKTLGENTRGMIHFTNEGKIQLPESHLFVRMATKFNDYEQFIERSAMSPTSEFRKAQTRSSTSSNITCGPGLRAGSDLALQSIQPRLELGILSPQGIHLFALLHGTLLQCLRRHH
jgi:hypothetical protein